MEVFFAILILNLVNFLMLSIFSIAFAKHKHDDFDNSIDTPISIIIAFRNEENNLSALLNSLLQQSYNGNYEIILVNDHSEDNYSTVLKQFSDNRISILNLPNGMEGKKTALRYAVDFAKGEILFFTDADCVVPTDWLLCMSRQMEQKGEKMLCGPVVFAQSNNFMHKLFTLEFMSLTGSGAAGFFINKPFMCNGANYAITRDVMKEAAAHLNNQFSSGDDVFLLHYVSSKYKVGFIKSNSATVQTLPPQNIKDFFIQRIRWASKTTGYRKAFAVFAAAITFLSAISILIAAILAIFLPEYTFLFGIIFVTKFLAELIFMIRICEFYKKQKLLWLLPLLQILHPFYIVITVLMSQVYKPYWKGRKIK